MSNDMISVPRELLELIRMAIPVLPKENWKVIGGIDDLLAQSCTCPSGDGSLRWRCPVCPPEPVAWMYKRHSAKERNGDMVQYISLSSSDLTEVRAGRHCEGHMVLSSCEDHYDWQPLYRHPPAQAPVVLPKRRNPEDFPPGKQSSVNSWNAYDDELKRLNPGITQAAPPRKS